MVSLPKSRKIATKRNVQNDHMHGRIIPWSTKKITSPGEGLCSFAKRRYLHEEMVIYLHV